MPLFLSLLYKMKIGPYTIYKRHELETSNKIVLPAYHNIGYIAETSLSPCDTIFDCHLGDELLGTVILRLDSANGLKADTNYSQTLTFLRKKGRKLAELSRFVIAPNNHTKSVVAALFHALYLHGSLINGVTDLFAEVIPRHTAAHEKWLQFKKAGDVTWCERVGVSVVLLHLDLKNG